MDQSFINHIDLVHDLFDVKENKNISLEEVLEGLCYVMHFRIQGGSQPHLDIRLMRRLCEALLLNTGHTEGHLLRKRSTHAADMAFFLFGDFLEEGKLDVLTKIDHFFLFLRCWEMWHLHILLFTLFSCRISCRSWREGCLRTQKSSQDPLSVSTLLHR